ncbi:UDP-N-acetylglucosamine 2-epimerase (non-hydrolyzing) [Thiotrichales bacterium 19S9-12]|nr:UDP-N-acetylglucosamine 2-epimerase (non-hydrolyzing) [Thiotrichales bacterium 19S9-11]MCF6810967.1 UDP-N-acetylglucosamine 2-epimerase (non-hydrolyzing) [Thiotrichales bacterium 19S9-12]
MKKIKVLSVFGTRPEAIKMAPVIKALEESDYHQSIICVTGQHREMLDQMLDLFELKADYDLDIMQPGQSLSMIASRTISLLDPILQKEKPDWVIVQGDTTSCFAAALSAFYHKIKVAHVEAGLRTYNLYSPYPEEANRQLVSRIADIHFAPTEVSKSNLIYEGINKDKVSVTGNTVIDALLWVKNKITWQNQWVNVFKTAAPVLEKKLPFIMITGHRRENHGQGFINICKAIKALAVKYAYMHFIYPVHLNPNVKKPVFELLSANDNIHLIEPLDYEPFIYLMTHCYLVLTDSGGVQEEAPSLGKPVLVMRDTTERPEGINAGTAKLVGTDKDDIITAASMLIDDIDAYNKMAQAVNPYGDGKASSRVISQII